MLLNPSCTVGRQRGGMELQRQVSARHEEGLSDNCLALILERRLPCSWVYPGGPGHTSVRQGFSC